MAPLVTQLRNGIEYGQRGMFKKHLIKNKKRQVMLICLQAGIEIPEHTSLHDGFITIIQGQGVFFLAGQEVPLQPGVFVELPANTRHALRAVKDLALLKVVDNQTASPPCLNPQPIPDEDPESEMPSKSSPHTEALADILKMHLQTMDLG